ncbi:hypothetical protein C0J52_05675 [Blattella germanica]|nr:hypothetical protein C0J52_05675 [Blattella germanica]
MLVVDGGCSTPGSASPSLLDSPTLARVERARLRQEGGGGGGGTSPLHHAACCQVNSCFAYYVIFCRRERNELVGISCWSCKWDYMHVDLCVMYCQNG